MAPRPPSRRRSVAACLGAMTSVAITLGLSWPLLAIALERQGVPAWLNGVSASVQMLAVLAVMPVAPRLIGRLGVVRMIALGMTGMAACLALLPVFPSPWAWLPIRFALGLGTELVFIAADIWINQLADERTRVRLIGVYGLFLHGGFALGPLAIVWLGSASWTPLYLGIALVAAGLLPLALARGTGHSAGDEPRARLLHYLRAALPLMLAGLLFGLVQSSTEVLLPIYGLAKGLDAEASAFLLTLAVSGAVLGQLPLGWLADHVPARRLLVAGAATILACLAALPAAIEHPVGVVPVLLALGAGFGSFYIVAMTMMGRAYRGADLIGVNTSFVFLWGVGAAAGPALGGSAMDLFGPDGLPALGVLLCVGFLAVVSRS